MAKEKKISVRTPSEIYEKLLQRAYELDLNHREYFLALAVIDLELTGSGKILSPELTEKIKSLIKELDNK